MGLDMYLEARRSLWSLNENDEKKSNRIASIFSEVQGLGRPKEVVVELMYWRKSNAIHKWFVDNVQNGIDECQESYVEKEKLQHLYILIKQTLNLRTIEAANTFLPPQSGFFFGSTDIDDSYWEDLEKTKETLEKILEADLGRWHIYYQASW